jgi:hypothetical protein
MKCVNVPAMGREYIPNLSELQRQFDRGDLLHATKISGFTMLPLAVILKVMKCD